MRAFTLLEAMLALVISGIVVASATVATVGIYRSLIAKEQQADADDQGRAVVDYLGSNVARLGNDYVVPAAVVSNDCWSRKATRCAGDALRYVELDASLPQVEITRVTPTARPRTGLPESVDVARVGDDCPLVAFAAGGRAGVDVVLLPPGGGFGAGWLAGRCSRIEATASACRCTLSAFTTTAALPAGAPHTPQADENGATPYPVDGGGWILAPGQAVTVWHDRDRTTLFEARDLANDGKLVVRALSDLVWEFRVQLAFENDAAPGTLEAWVTNPDTDNRDEATVGARLRAVRVGVIAGARAPSRTTPSSASLFPGDATAVVSRAETKGALLRAASGTFILRNTIRY